MSLSLVLLIALAQHRGWSIRFDNDMMQAAGQARATRAGQAITPVMIGASIVGDTAGRIAMTVFIGGLLLWRGRNRAALWLIAVVIGGALLNSALKQIFAAPRPQVLAHLDIVNSYSFPSGHAAGNMTYFGALAMLGGWRHGWTIAAIPIMLIGASRVWLGVHWPSDVAAGWIEGIGWLALCGAYLKR